MELNSVNLVGNLTRDPEANTLQSGDCVVNFGMAVNRKTNQGDEVMYIDITVFGKTAENCSQYLSKGSQVAILGRLKLEQWQDKQTGQNRSKHVIVANQVSFGARPQGQQQNQQQGGHQNQNAGGFLNQNQGGYSNQQPNIGGGYQQQNGGNQGGYNQQNQGGNW